MLQEESRALPAKVAVPFLEVSEGCRTGLLTSLGLTVICPWYSLGSADQAIVETLGGIIWSVIWVLQTTVGRGLYSDLRPLSVASGYQVVLLPTTPWVTFSTMVQGTTITLKNLLSFKYFAKTIAFKKVHKINKISILIFLVEDKKPEAFLPHTPPARLIKTKAHPLSWGCEWTRPSLLAPLCKAEGSCIFGPSWVLGNIWSTSHFSQHVPANPDGNANCNYCCPCSAQSS